jgi:phospholipid/cholesterol/gamma-HCH transport system substrate-binding protein
MALYQARQVDHVRHTNEWVGLMVVLAALLFVGAVLEAGVLRDWFRPVSRLRILLPQSGVGGLAVGADIDVLGIRAGRVTRVVLNPNQIYAEADIDQQAEAFIRRDSEAVIRRSFGIVGARLCRYHARHRRSIELELCRDRGDHGAISDRHSQQHDR